MARANLVEEVKCNGDIIAIIIRDGYKGKGVSFFTPNNFSQQLAFMHHPQGEIIKPHIHNLKLRRIFYTQEVLVMKKGKIRVSLYSAARKFIGEKILNSGDIILLASGGHGFQMLEETEMIAVKQGPYRGEKDKQHFEALDDSGK